MILILERNDDLQRLPLPEAATGTGKRQSLQCTLRRMGFYAARPPRSRGLQPVPAEVPPPQWHVPPSTQVADRAE